MSDVGESLGGLARSTLIILVGTIFGRALGLLGETVIARSLPPAEYGHLALAYTIAILAARVAVFGTNSGVTRMMSAVDGQTNRSRLLHHGYLLVLATSLIIALLLAVGRHQLASLANDEPLSTYLLYLLPFVVLYPIERVVYGALQAEKRSVSAVLSKDVGGRLIPLAVLTGAIYTGVPMSGAVLYWVGVPLTAIPFALYFLKDRYPVWEIFRYKPDTETLSRLWSFSWPLAMSTSIFIFLSNLDVLMIGYFMNSSSVGHYRAIQPLQQAATFILASFTFLYLPIATTHFEQGDFEGLQELYVVSTKWVLTGTFPIVLVFGFFADDVVRSFLGMAYIPAASALSILVLGLFFRAVVGLNGDMTKAIDRTKIELYSGTAGLLVNFFLNVALVPRYGINGAALATVVGYFVYNSLEVVAIYRAVGVHPFAWNNFKSLVPTALFAIGLYKVTTGTEFGLGGLIAIGITISVVQAASIILTQSLDPADMYIIEKVEVRTDTNLGWLKSQIRD